jgi:regulator of replication initiation timing
MACTTAIMPGGVCPDCGWDSSKSAEPHPVAHHADQTLSKAAVVAQDQEVVDAMITELTDMKKHMAELTAENVTLKEQAAAAKPKSAMMGIGPADESVAALKSENAVLKAENSELKAKLSAAPTPLKPMFGKE